MKKFESVMDLLLLLCGLGLTIYGLIQGDIPETIFGCTLIVTGYLSIVITENSINRIGIEISSQFDADEFDFGFDDMYDQADALKYFMGSVTEVPNGCGVFRPKKEQQEEPPTTYSCNPHSVEDHWLKKKLEKDNELRMKNTAWGERDKRSLLIGVSDVIRECIADGKPIFQEWISDYNTYLSEVNRTNGDTRMPGAADIVEKHRQVHMNRENLIRCLNVGKHPVAHEVLEVYNQSVIELNKLENNKEK